jgi:Leucine-rich repeat (LRR) protein
VGRVLYLPLMVLASTITCMAFAPTALLQDKTASPPSLGSLEITGLKRTTMGYMPVETLKAIAAQEKLETLDLSGCNLAQSDYEWLADLRGLRVLSLHRTGIRDPGFTRLAGLRELEELDLSDNDLTQKSLPVIASLPRLRKLSLDLSEGLPDSKELAHLASLKELRTLTISLKGTDEEWRILSTFTTLEGLDVEADRITEAGLNQLSALKDLRRLKVKPSPDPWRKRDQNPPSIAPALQLPCLESLELWWVPVGDAWAARLNGCPNLRRLYLHSASEYRNRLTDIGVAKIAEFTRMRELTLFNVDDLTDQGVEKLANLKELRILSLSCCDAITDKAVVHLVKLRHLRELDLSCPKVTDQGIRLLPELKELEELEISSSGATDACIPDLAKIPRLKVLWIIQTKITRAGYNRLYELLPGRFISMKRSSFSIGRSGGRATDKEPEPAKAGVAIGTLVAKGRAWIEVKADGEKKPRAYAPIWEGDAPDYGGRWDDKTLKAIKNLEVGSRLRVEWKYDLRPRIVKMEVLKP